MNGVITGLSTIASLGLPQILLWLLSFAIAYELVEKSKITSKKATTGLVAIVISLLVVIAAPVSLLAAISTMSTSMILLAVAGLVLASIYVVLPNVEMGDWIKKIMSIVAIVVAIYVFSAAGGFALIGMTNIAIPFVSNAAIVSIAMIALVFWFVSRPETAATPAKTAE